MSESLDSPAAHLFQLCDHSQYNHLSQFSCAAEQRFNRPQLKKSTNALWIKAVNNFYLIQINVDSAPETCFDLPPQQLRWPAAWTAHGDAYA